MWFVFGFISLIGFVAYSLHQRVTAKWIGTRSVVRHKPFEYEVLVKRIDRSDKTKSVGLRIGVTAPTVYDFSFKPEKWRDWLSKRIGFSVEYQTGDAEFDKAVYILSNDARIHVTLSQNAALRADILRVFRIVAPRSAVLKEVRCSGGRIWIHYKLKTELDRAKISVLAEQVVPALSRLAADLGRATVAGAPQLYDRFILRAAIILAISTGLALNGVAHVARLLFVPIPFTVDNSTLILWSLYCGAALLALLVLAVVLFLGRSARAHVVLLEVLLVGSVGAVLTSFVELRDLNMEWDQQPAMRYEVTTVSKRISRGRRSRTYYVTISGWPNKNNASEIKVSSSLYHHTDRGGELELLQKPGFLKIPWVAALMPREQGR
jgi:hypothetical protein